MNLHDPEIFVAIVWYLDPFDLLHLLQVSQSLKKLVEDDQLRWKTICFEEKIELIGSNWMASWKEIGGKRKKVRQLLQEASNYVFGNNCPNNIKRVVPDECKLEEAQKLLNVERKLQIKEGIVKTKLDLNWILPPNYREFVKILAPNSQKGGNFNRCCRRTSHRYIIPFEIALQFQLKHELLMLPFYFDGRNFFLLDCSNSSTAQKVYVTTYKNVNRGDTRIRVWPLFFNAWLDVVEWEKTEEMRNRKTKQNVMFFEWLMAYHIYVESTNNQKFLDVYPKCVEILEFRGYNK